MRTATLVGLFTESGYQLAPGLCDYLKPKPDEFIVVVHARLARAYPDRLVLGLIELASALDAQIAESVIDYAAGEFRW